MVSQPTLYKKKIKMSLYLMTFHQFCLQKTKYGHATIILESNRNVLIKRITKSRLSPINLRGCLVWCNLGGVVIH